MRRFQSLLALVVPGAIVIAAAAGGCSTTNGTPASGGDGTTPIAQSQAHALVTGTVDSSVQGNIQMAVNGKPHPLLLAPDQSFVVRDVPTGDVTIECDAGNVRGTITVSNVQPGENIQVTIKREGDAIVIVIVARTQASQPPMQVTQQGGTPLKITASHACYWLNPGHYTRDIIVTGDDVHIFGAAHDTCSMSDYSVIEGKLELDGNGITVLDVDLTGTLVLGGQNCKVQDTCSHCYDESCEHACGDEDGNQTCGSDAGAAQPDAGGPLPDAAAPSPDGGTPQPDSGVPVDSGGPAPDGSAPDAGAPDSGAKDAGASDAPSGG